MHAAVFNNDEEEYCMPCFAGKYHVGEGCVACEAGKYQNDTGKDGLHGCESGKAPAGKRQDRGTNCHPGYYANTTGLTRCSECAAGKYSTSVGASTEAMCVPRERNKYQNLTGDVVLQLWNFSTDVYDISRKLHYGSPFMDETVTGQTTCKCDPGYQRLLDCTEREQLLVLDRCGPDNRDFSDAIDSGSYRAENPGEDVNPCFTCDEGKISGPGAVGEVGCTQCPWRARESCLYCTNCEPGTTSLDEWGECKPADGLPPVVEVTPQLIEEGDTCAQVSHSNTECESKPVDFKCMVLIQSSRVQLRIQRSWIARKWARQCVSNAERGVFQRHGGQ